MTTTIDAASSPAPVATAERIQSLDVLRGFALLGILLLNILGFGLHSAGYFNPLIGIGDTELSRTVNLSVWGAVSVFFEGAMRALFSMLFGAGVVLFTSGGRRPLLHFKRNFWLLLFGVVNAYVLLWNGDILITYAIAGVILYGMRNWSPRQLFITAGILIAGMSLFYGFYYFGLAQARETGDVLWQEFVAEYSPSAEVYQHELDQRRSGYAGAFSVNLQIKIYMTLFVLPVILIWDALAMMLIGMALYKLHVLDASRSMVFYKRMMFFGFATGLSINLWELAGAVRSDFDLLATVPIVAWTYHLGRIGMATGYLGLVMLICKSGLFANLRFRLAAVGRLALTNYLSHSLICLFLFTGAGFGLVGELERWQLYLVVFAIWAFQLWFSPWWLRRNRFGPMEWLWRRLTYGSTY